jgi:hypothetical protein
VIAQGGEGHIILPFAAMAGPEVPGGRRRQFF